MVGSPNPDRGGNRLRPVAIQRYLGDPAREGPKRPFEQPDNSAIFLVPMSTVLFHFEQGVRPDGKVTAIFHVEVDLAVTGCDDGIGRAKPVSPHRTTYLLRRINQPGFACHEIHSTGSFERPRSLHPERRKKHDNYRQQVVT